MATANLFTQNRIIAPQTSTFDNSHGHKTTLNMGQLIPITVLECVPGDRHTISHEILARMMPLVTPVMHRFKIYTHTFFVPNRILWDNWETFITGQNLFPSNVPPVPPTLEITNENSDFVKQGSLADYMGLPPEKMYRAADDNDINILPFAAYNAIWSEWYRDQNLIPGDSYSNAYANEKEYKVQDGVFDATAAWGGNPYKRAWKHDYFTAALPWPQKGEDIVIPFNEFDDVDLVRSRGNSNGDHYRRAPWNDEVSVDDATGAFVDGNLTPEGTGQSSQIDIGEFWQAETSQLQVPAPTINELRRAFALQRWMEINARGGSRYIEHVKAHFNVKSSDARMQRPEFLGGSISNFVVSEVLQTAGPNEDPESGVVGDMAGHGINASEGGNIKYFCEEHGWIITILSILPEADYFQGIPRHFCARKDKFDYLWPALANLGEQPIINKELYYEGDELSADEDNATFGYIPRYAEYRYQPNRISSAMRSSLNNWHYARIFNSRPNLNQNFIEFSEDFRIYAVEDESDQHVIMHYYCHCWSNRRLPKYATPI